MQIAPHEISVRRRIFETQDRKAITDTTRVELPQSLKLDTKWRDRQFVLWIPFFVHVALALPVVMLSLVSFLTSILTDSPSTDSRIGTYEPRFT